MVDEDGDEIGMTVGEVIERLRQFPADLLVSFVYDSGCAQQTYNRCFAVKWVGGWHNPPVRRLLVNIHPELHWGGHDTEEEQLSYVNDR